MWPTAFIFLLTFGYIISAVLFSLFRVGANISNHYHYQFRFWNKFRYDQHDIPFRYVSHQCGCWTYGFVVWICNLSLMFCCSSAEKLFCCRCQVWEYVISQSFCYECVTIHYTWYTFYNQSISNFIRIIIVHINCVPTWSINFPSNYFHTTNNFENIKNWFTKIFFHPTESQNRNSIVQINNFDR